MRSRLHPAGPELVGQLARRTLDAPPGTLGRVFDVVSRVLQPAAAFLTLALGLAARVAGELTLQPLGFTRQLVLRACHVSAPSCATASASRAIGSPGIEPTNVAPPDPQRLPPKKSRMCAT